MQALRRVVQEPEHLGDRGYFPADRLSEALSVQQVRLHRRPDRHQLRPPVFRVLPLGRVQLHHDRDGGVRLPMDLTRGRVRRNSW